MYGKYRSSKKSTALDRSPSGNRDSTCSGRTGKRSRLCCIVPSSRWDYSTFYWKIKTGKYSPTICLCCGAGIGTAFYSRNSGPGRPRGGCIRNSPSGPYQCRMYTRIFCWPCHLSEPWWTRKHSRRGISSACLPGLVWYTSNLCQKKFYLEQSSRAARRCLPTSYTGALL